MPQRFFITHSWKDIEFARKLSNDLCASGLDGFLDAHSMNPGDSIPSRIERGLKECDVYIPIFSPDALKSDWCDWEIDMAITMNRTRKGRPRIIPVIAKPCSVPDRLIHLLYVDFVGRYDDALNELLTKGLGLSPKSITESPPRRVSASGAAERAPASFLTPQWKAWLVPVGALAAIVVIGCVLGIIAFFALTPTPTPVLGTSIAGPSAKPPTVQATVPPSTTAMVATVPLVPTTATVPPTPTQTATITPRPATLTPSPIPTPGIGSTMTSTIDGAIMFYVPAGEFTMGSSDSDKDAYGDEKPPHTVYLDEFWIDEFEVTNALYKKCVDARNCVSPSSTKSATRDSYYGNSQYDNYPVIYVSWNDANTFCAWAGKRLPTEAEWEKAARGTDKRVYPWGNTFDKNLLNSSEGGRGDTTAVGSYLSGASPYGALDMAGNVWEWVADWYDSNYYSISPRNNPKGPSSGVSHVVRGGSWYNNSSSMRAATRYYLWYDSGWDLLGFRCAQ